jgi:hypothetical protein
MHISPEIRAAQEAYAARPFAVRWEDSHMSGTFRFDSFTEAFDYVQIQWARVQRRVRENRHMASHLWHSYLETPEGRVPLRYVLLCDDVSSY